MLANNAFVVATGRRGTGKTTMIKEILYRKRKCFNWGIVMTGTAASAVDYAKHIPDSFIFEGYNRDIIRNLVLRQEHDHKKYGKSEPVFLVLEDLMWEKKNIWKDDYMRRLAMNGRWDNIFVVVAMQYPMDFGPELRNQVDVAFCCIEKLPRNRERIFECFNPCFRTFDEFDHVMIQCTKDNEVLVLQVGGTTSTKVEDSVFYTKAKPGRKFRVSKDKPWWHYHKMQYDPHYFAAGDETAPPKPGGKKQGAPQPVIVKSKTTKRKSKSKVKPRAFVLG